VAKTPPEVYSADNQRGGVGLGPPHVPGRDPDSPSRDGGAPARRNSANAFLAPRPDYGIPSGVRPAVQTPHPSAG